MIRIFEDAAWIDEAASIGIGTLPWSVLFGEMARIEASPPGYYAIAKVVGILAGPEAGPLRVISAVAAALAVVPVWLFCRAAFGVRAAWLAAVLVALNAALIRMSQDGRAYALLFLVFCCALLAAWRIVEAARRGEGGVGAVLGLAVAQGAMLWLHHTAAIANLGLNIFVLVALLGGRAGVRGGIVRLAAADTLGLLVAAAPILWAMGHATEGAFVTRWIEAPGLVDAIMTYVHGVVAPFHSPLSGITIVLSAAMMAWGGLALRKPGWPARAGLIGMVGFAGLAIPLVSQAWPIMLDRTVLFLVAPVSAGIAAGAALLPHRAFLAVAGVLVALHAFGAAAYHQWPTHRERWQEVAQVLGSRVEPGDRVVVTDSVFSLISLRMALAERGGPQVDALVVPATSPLELRSAALLAPEAAVAVEDLCQRLRGARTVWLITRPAPPVVANNPAFATRPMVIERLRAHGGVKRADHAATAIEVDRWDVPGC